MARRTVNQFQRVYEVFDIFKDFFGEEYVDLQGIGAGSPFILAWWPSVTVTNENDKSIVIQDLYAKIGLTSNGLIPTENKGFLLNRATYPIEQWVSNYMH